MTDAYERELFHGKLLDKATIAALKEAEGLLGYELTIYQGIGGASASAGTHTEGRAVDLSAWDKTRKLRVLKNLGFAIWYRPTIRGLWSEHIHGILILNEFSNSHGVAPAGFRQIGYYMRGLDGLRSNREDHSYRPSPLVAYKYPPKEKPVPVEKKDLAQAKDKLVEAAHALGEAAVALERAKRPTEEGKVRFSVHAAAARSIRRTVNGLHHRLPKN